MKRQSLAWENLQAVLDSASNAAQKGMQQFFTPPEIARALAIPLPSVRPSITDLQCGSGNLLFGAANSDTEHLIGTDIDPASSIPATGNASRHFATCDIQKLYPLLCEVDWRADLFVLNPPFSLRWNTETLHALSDSERPAVAQEWKRHSRKTSIDSVLATFLIALDRLTDRGEGYLICSQSTAERILPGDSPLRSHVWLWIRTPNFFPDTDPEMEVAIIYFCAAEQSEFRQREFPAITSAAMRKISREEWREGLDVYHAYRATNSTASLFDAAKEELRAQEGATRRLPFNIWLGVDGTIQRHLTPFQAASGKVPRDLVSELHKLQGQVPLSLVVQKATRCALVRAVHSAHWRVEPRLIEAVERAVRDYESVRAPFNPLNEVQRLGYLDEYDNLTCKVSFAAFRAGKAYNISSRTVPIQRVEKRINLLGKPEDVQIQGNELLIEIKGDDGRKHSFTFDTNNENVPSPSSDLQSLIAHFEIPEVPDIASLFPDRYHSLLSDLDLLERSFNSLVSTPIV